MAHLDGIARRYGVRPSALVGEAEPLKALAIDQQAHAAGVRHEEYLNWRHGALGRPKRG